MKKVIFLSVFYFVAVCVAAQTDEQKLIQTLSRFHQDMVNKNIVSINQHTDKALSYGHSNGWVETKNEFIANLKNGYIVYKSYREDSIKVNISGNVAHARFIAGIRAILQGEEAEYHLHVLEVWVRKGNRWLLFARQAVKKEV
ncbi:MAG: nuclear transport factor 2 family protein [Chitinophagaceae bacterium]|nr:nuclear transport factor 2 family protein [Chitinophagaceae bacterium]